MADKAISELIAANQVTPTDLFILEQSGTAKKLTGQTLENWLLSFADGHGGIQSIVKQSTSGLKDTYRITLADTTTVDFVVTNGKSISNVQQTKVSGLTRTYTIAFNDGTKQTFTVTDGRSITDIEKTGTSGLTDTYTISYNDNSTSTFTVKNGKGISSFAKVSTSGLVDTYRITYNDNTYNEFTVTNGAKGAKGDTQYVWIKYASQKPTASSHSFGDVPDNWIGVYSGASSSAPSDWTKYSWFEIKGEKGDTGSPAKLNSFKVDYQVSESGTVIPSNSWSTYVPVVAQGKYLWTRTTNTFNTGSPVVSYSVTRMGLDGSGSVASVANVSPDDNGNVPLTAEHLNALSTTGGSMTGSIDMNGQDITGLNNPTEDTQAANMGFVNQQVRKAAPRNILDNSYFRNPVNQRGKASYSGRVYGIDRWMGYGDSCKVDIKDDYISIMTGVNKKTKMWVQYLPDGEKMKGRTYTMAARVRGGRVRVNLCNKVWSLYDTNDDWRVIVATKEVPDAAEEFFFGIQTDEYTECDVEWAALYEGTYDADTVREYRPKGYAAELLECQRYFLQLGTTLNGCRIASGIADSPTSAVLFVPMPVVMREAKPKFTIEDPTKIYFQVGNRTNIRDFAWNYTYPGNVALGLSFSFDFADGDTGLEYGAATVMVQEKSTSITLDAELVKES